MSTSHRNPSLDHPIPLPTPASHRIPWEILTSIIDQVDDTPTLAELCLVSSSVLEPAAKRLYRTVELTTASQVLLFLHAPSALPPTSHLAPHIGLHLVQHLSFTLPRSEYPTPTSTSQTLLTDSHGPRNPPLPSTPARLLYLRTPSLTRSLPLSSLTVTASSRDSAIDESLRIYLPYLNPTKLVLTTSAQQKGPFFSPNVRQSRGLRADVGGWTRLEEVVSDGAVLVELDPGSIGLSMTLLPYMRGAFASPPASSVSSSDGGGVDAAQTSAPRRAIKLTFDLRRERRAGFQVWAGVNVAKSWAKFVKWLEESGVRRTEEIGEGEVVVRVSHEEDERCLEEALAALSELGRRKYKVILDQAVKVE